MATLLVNTNHRELPPQLVDRILATPVRSVRRWRMAAAFWMAQDPENRAEALAVMQWCKQQKQAQVNEFGTSGEKTGRTAHLRSPLSMPGDMLSTIEIADPGLLDKDEAKTNLRKLAKAFPEFCPVERI